MISILLNNFIIEECLNIIFIRAIHNFTYNKIKVGDEYSKLIITSVYNSITLTNATITDISPFGYIGIKCQIYTVKFTDINDYRTEMVCSNKWESIDEVNMSINYTNIHYCNNIYIYLFEIGKLIP